MSLCHHCVSHVGQDTCTHFLECNILGMRLQLISLSECLRILSEVFTADEGIINVATTQNILIVSRELPAE